MLSLRGLLQTAFLSIRTGGVDSSLGGHGFHQRGFTVISLRNDGHISDVVPLVHDGADLHVHVRVRVRNHTHQNITGESVFFFAAQDK